MVCTVKEQNALFFFSVCLHSQSCAHRTGHCHVCTYENYEVLDRLTGKMDSINIHTYVYTYMCSHCMQGEPSFMHTCRARLRGSKGAEVSRQCSLSLGPPLLSAELFLSLLNVLWHLGLPSLSLCLLYCLLMSLLVHSLSFSPCFTAT